MTTAPENEVARNYIESATPDVLIIAGVGKQLSGEVSIKVRMRIDATKKKPEILEQKRSMQSYLPHLSISLK